MLAAALTLGILLAWVDSRPTWDDTGLMVAVLLILSAGFSMIHPRLAWLWALALGAWIPLFDIVLTRNFGSVIALVLAFIGAYVGLAIRTLLFPKRSRAQPSNHS